MAQAIAALTGGWGEDNDVKVAVNEGDSRYLFLDHKINLQMEYEIVFFFSSASTSYSAFFNGHLLQSLVRTARRL